MLEIQFKRRRSDSSSITYCLLFLSASLRNCAVFCVASLWSALWPLSRGDVHGCRTLGSSSPCSYSVSVSKTQVLLMPTTQVSTFCIFKSPEVLSNNKFTVYSTTLASVTMLFIQHPLSDRRKFSNKSSEKHFKNNETINGARMSESCILLISAINKSVKLPSSFVS